MATTTSDTKEITFVEAPESNANGYPVKLVGWMAELGHDGLAKWLKEQNAPKEIQELAEGLRGVVMVMEEAKNDNLADIWNECTGDNLAAIMRGMAFTHVELSTKDSIWSA